MQSKFCEYCKIEFVPFNNRQRFCSFKCRAIVMPPPIHGTHVTIICEYCHKEFNVCSARAKKTNTRFCSMQCRIDANGMVSARGKDHWNWKGGKTKFNSELRHSKEYNEWRKSVYKRDYWTCTVCHKKQKHPIAHHLKSFNDFPELRYDINNGITLCRSCHGAIHKKI